QPPKVDHQFVGGLIPIRELLFKSLADNALQLLGHFGIKAWGWWGLVAENLRNNRGTRLTPECALTCRHLVQHRAKGEYVAASVQFLTFGLLRGHIADGAENFAPRCHRAGERSCVQCRGGWGMLLS